MAELGQLDSHSGEFKARKVEVVAVSIEGMEEAKATQAQFPHLVIVSDAERNLSEAVEVIHERSSPSGGDTSAPTTLLIDGKGTIRLTFRPDRVFTRLSPGQLLAAIDRELPAP